MGHPTSTIIGNDDDTVDASGNSSAIGFLRNILAALGGTLGAAFSKRNITTATTINALKTGAGMVRNLNVNTGGAGSSIVLYDSLTATGTKLGTFDTATQIALALNIPFTTGLTAVTSGGTPADVTIVYA